MKVCTWFQHVFVVCERSQAPTVRCLHSAVHLQCGTSAVRCLHSAVPLQCGSLNCFRLTGGSLELRNYPLYLCRPVCMRLRALDVLCFGCSSRLIFGARGLSAGFVGVVSLTNGELLVDTTGGKNAPQQSPRGG